MSERPLSIGVIGAGMGGLTAAALLRRAGHQVRVYEQASRFARVGAGIQMTPNALKALAPLGIVDSLSRVGFRSPYYQNRDAFTGEPTFRLELGEAAEAAYEAPYLYLHRGDLHGTLAKLVSDIVELERQVSGLEQMGDRVELRFADGGNAAADIVVAADGVHSTVRGLLFGPSAARFTGRVSCRSVYPVERLEEPLLDPAAKWWGPDRHLVMYYVRGGKEVYFGADVPEPEWTLESWTAKGDVNELREAFSAFHTSARSVLRATPDVYKYAIYERDPMEGWTAGRIALLGDSCHPMAPYMAQGAATAMEDAVVLTRSLAGAEQDGVEEALIRYEQTRKARTARIQLASRGNTWLHFGEDTSWVFDFDPWTVELGSSGGSGRQARTMRESG